MTDSSFKATPYLIAALLFTGCSTQPPVDRLAESLPLDTPADLAATDDWTTELSPQIQAIDIENSYIHIKVYRAGRLARLGHNHVITARKLQGYVYIGSNPVNSGLTLSIPVSDLVVDDPTIRANLGEDFRAPVSNNAILGTRKNLLGSKILDMATFPFIHIKSLNVKEAPPNLKLLLAVTLKGITREINTTATIERQNGIAHVLGQFNISQKELGIVPFSLFGGALSVADSLTISYDIGFPLAR